MIHRGEERGAGEAQYSSDEERHFRIAFAQHSQRQRLGRFASLALGGQLGLLLGPATILKRLVAPGAEHPRDASHRESSPTTMSSAGLIVCLALLVSLLEPPSANTITHPQVMLVV